MKNTRIKNIIILSICAPVLVGIVLLIIEYEIFVPKEKNIRSIPKIKIQSTQFPVLNDSLINLREHPKQDNNNLQSLYEVAKKIYGADPRNEQFSKIIDIALNEDNLEFAFTVAKDMYGVDPRNAEFKKIVIAALKMKKYDFAARVADEVYGADPRNEVYKLIITEKSKNADTKN